MNVKVSGFSLDAGKFLKFQDQNREHNIHIETRGCPLGNQINRIYQPTLTLPFVNRHKTVATVTVRVCIIVCSKMLWPNNIQLHANI